jgi:hypothetical protein
MPHQWLKRIRKTGQLTVYNKATAWAVPVAAAIKTFNNLSLGVTVVAEQAEKAANIVLVLASRPGEQYKYYGDTAETAQDFKADILHGQTTTLQDKKKEPYEIFFAAVFLPGKITKATNGQKEMVVVHELFHASGLDGWHDSVGIMFADMKEEGGGLIEYLHDKGAKPMPPIRLGAQTLCQMKMLWADAKDCKED